MPGILLTPGLSPMAATHDQPASRRRRSGAARGSKARSPPSPSTGPRAFNSIDLAIAKKAGATRRRGRGVRRNPGAGDRRRRPRLLRAAAISRPSAPPRPPTPSRPWSANCCTTTTPSSPRLRRMPKIVLASVHGSAAGAGLSLAFVADLCIAAEDARFTPAYAKLGVSPDGGGTAGVVAAVGTAAGLADLSRRGQLFGRPGRTIGAWSSRSFQPPN